MIPDSKETIKIISKKMAKTLLAFSTGKDAIGTWLAIRDSFDSVEPYYLYLVPGLQFVEESLQYYEQKFGKKIHRLPHPSLHRWLNSYTFQPPERRLVIQQAGLPLHDYEDIRVALTQDLGLPEDTFVADGVRAADSPLRLVSIKKNGPISWASHKYHPIWDWKKADLAQCFEKHNVSLPIDYKVFGRSFDGLDLRFLVPMKKHMPEDYRRLLDWFPLADLEVYRWEKSNGH